MNRERSLKYIFGPVPSRRLGLSLGIDLVPYKTCSYDCIYCQLGRTTDKICKRAEYAPVKRILEELRQKLASPPFPDYITLSGSGEPTLHSGIGELISGIKSLTRIPVAILTNSSLLWDRDVCASCARADLVVPSLDAGDEDSFLRVNKPHSEITFQKMVDGLVSFSKTFSNHLWLEVFLIDGITTEKKILVEIKKYIELICPEKVQLNTVARPPAEESAVSVPEKSLYEIAGFFGASAEVIADFPVAKLSGSASASKEDVLQMLRRRPCTLKDISMSLGIHRNESLKYLGILLKKGLVKREAGGDREYYTAV